MWVTKRKKKTLSFKSFIAESSKIYNNITTMGRGRTGIINQSVKKLAPRRHHNIAKFFGPPDKSGETKINLPEDALEFMKNMNKQQLVDFLLSNDDWHVKTSGINASGS